MTTTEIIEATQQPVATVQPMAPALLLQTAIERGASLDVLERLMTLQDRFEAGEARKAYNDAFAAFKSEGVRIVKNTDVKDGPLKGKSYADLFAVVDSLTPALSRHGLSASWRVTKDEKDWIEVACVLAHKQGHSETVTMGGPPDSGGAKNAIQARASAHSYLRRYTFMAITGMAATDEDDDGASSGAAGVAANDLLNELIFEMKKTTTDDEALTYFKGQRAQLASDKKAYEAFKEATADHRKTLAAKAAEKAEGAAA